MAKIEKKTQKKNKNQTKKDEGSAREKLKKRKCFYHNRQCHYIRDCAEKKEDDKEIKKDAAVASNDSSNDGYHNADLLVASSSNIRG